MDTRRRIGVVDDHDIVVRGLERILEAESELEIVVASDSVPALLDRAVEIDLAILDLLLPDGSSPTTNIAALHAAGIGVLIYTSGDRPDLVRTAAGAGVLGVVRKTERAETIIDAIRTAAAGLTVASMDWAAAIDADSEFAPHLTPRQRDVLALYASGETAEGVAAQLNLSRNTVNNYLQAIRQRYADVGRPANTKSELRRVAQEDGLAPRTWWPRHR